MSDFVLDNSKVLKHEEIDYIYDDENTIDSELDKLDKGFIPKIDVCRAVQELKKDFDELAKTNNNPKNYYDYEKGMIDERFACCAGGKGEK